MTPLSPPEPASPELWRALSFRDRMRATAGKRLLQAMTLLLAAGETEAARLAEEAMKGIPGHLPAPPDDNDPET